MIEAGGFFACLFACFKIKGFLTSGETGLQVQMVLSNIRMFGTRCSLKAFQI